MLNLAPEPGETAGFSPEQHLAVLAEHAPDLRVDAVLADVGVGPGAGPAAPGGRGAARAGRAGPPGADRRDGPDDAAARPPALADALRAVRREPDPARYGGRAPAGAGGRRLT